MSYSTLDDLLKDLSEAELIQLTDDEGGGAVNEEIYAEQRDDADAEIDGYLTGGGYTVPLLPVPRLIVSISKVITSYRLHKRRLKLNMPQSLVDDYKAQVKLLEAIQAGKVAIGAPKADAGDGTVTGSGNYRTNKTAADRKFPDSELDKW
jgi:phage gp36-like protein